MMNTLYQLCLLATVLAVSQGLVCLECECPTTDISTCDCDAPSDANDGSVCVIYELNVDDDVQVQLTRMPLVATYIDIEDTYLLLAQEQIEWNNVTNKWTVETENVFFACDWDYCNDLDYVGNLPKSFEFKIDETWLDQNIYGTGSTDSCYHCETPLCGNATSPINQDSCPMTSCEAPTSCVAADLWDNLLTNDQCYQSRCWSNTDEGPRQRIVVEAVIYLAQDRSEIDVWELDVYCSAPSCTRSTIFQEILSRLEWNINGLDMFPSTRPQPTTTTQPTTTRTIRIPLRCYRCDCSGTTECPCNRFETALRDEAYCVIIQQFNSHGGDIYLGHLRLDATQNSIRDFPYALIEEAIDYNETLGRWITFTNFAMYGCNWDECNKPELVKYMPNTYQLVLPVEWLNQNVLGNGQPVRDCHECPGQPQCGTATFLNATQCPIRGCNTTCLVSDTVNDVVNDKLCYQSYCLPPDTPFYQYPKHRVEIEAVVYAQRPSVVEIWEVDVFCRADDCSRPELFKELRNELRFHVDTLDELFNETAPPNDGKRRCYDCVCLNSPTCNCNVTTDEDARSTYCTIVVEYTGQSSRIIFEHIQRNSTAVYIRQFPYLLIEEAITFKEDSGKWLTNTNFAIFGCNWDYCNHPSLLPYVPSGFQMKLSEAWLNLNILGTGQPARDCHECPDAPQCGFSDFLDVGRCPIRPCNRTCLVSDSFNDPTSDEFCYQSFCAPADIPSFLIDPHRVEIEAIVYAARPDRYEIWEIDLFCRADDCSRPTIFQELREDLTLEVGNLQPLFNLTLTSTSTTTTTTTPSSSSTTTTTTTTTRTTTTTTTPTTTTRTTTTTTTTTTRTTTTTASSTTSTTTTPSPTTPSPTTPSPTTPSSTTSTTTNTDTTSTTGSSASVCQADLLFMFMVGSMVLVRHFI